MYTYLETMRVEHVKDDVMEDIPLDEGNGKEEVVDELVRFSLKSERQLTEKTIEDDLRMIHNLYSTSHETDEEFLERFNRDNNLNAKFHGSDSVYFHVNHCNKSDKEHDKNYKIFYDTTPVYEDVPRSCLQMFLGMFRRRTVERRKVGEALSQMMCYHDGVSYNISYVDPSKSSLYPFSIHFLIRNGIKRITIAPNGVAHFKMSNVKGHEHDYIFESNTVK